MDEFYNKHYILTDENERIVDGWSSGPHPDSETNRVICINERGDYQFRLEPDGCPEKGFPVRYKGSCSRNPQCFQRFAVQAISILH